MITFFPKEMPIWKDFFVFKADITLTPKEKTNYKVFQSRNELVDFCKEFGVDIKASYNPIQIMEDFNNENYGVGTYVVKQGDFILGWMKEDFR